MIHTACRAALRCRGSGHVRVLHAMGARTAPRTRPRVAQCVLHVRGMADDIVLHPPPPEDETTFETPLTDSQVQVARERDYQLRLKHGALPTGDQTGAADLETYRYVGLACWLTTARWGVRSASQRAVC